MFIGAETFQGYFSTEAHLHLFCLPVTVKDFGLDATSYC